MVLNTDLNLDDVFLDAEAALKEIPAEEKLMSLSKLGLEQFNLEQEINAIETMLDEKKKAHRELAEVKIPELLDELGFDEFKLSNGVKVSVQPYYSAKITDMKAYEWLEQNKHADIIKGEVSIPFPKGYDKAKLKAIYNIAKEFGLQADIGEQVHPSTLRAWVKDMVQTGQIFPRELFNVYVGKRTKLTLK